MAADAIGDGCDLWSAREVDGEPASTAERIAVELEPAGRAAARQPAVRNDDVGIGARADQGPPLDRLR